MPWKFVGDLRLHNVLQTTIVRQITKLNVEIEKIEKYSKNNVGIAYQSLCVLVSMCVCVLVWVIVAYYCVWIC